MDSETRRKMGKVIAKAWSDDGYRQRLTGAPHEVLAEAGISVPAGTKISVMEDSASQMHLVLPAKPSDVSAEKLSSGDVHPDFCKFIC